ncbi:glycoside hydrolase family 61 protein [Xylaria nigripes]|nr:glycoside hydrolase family 61 protein [Xylaria nigripes]
MKYSHVTALALAITAEAHCIFQEVSVNDQKQGSLVALRAPSDNNPVTDVSSDDIVCQTPGTTSDEVIAVQAGDDMGAYFGHVIGGAQIPNDPDNPIAASHKGPLTAWMAKVDDAATSSKMGLEWFKIWEDTFDPSTGIWGVDNLIASEGWTKFQLPACITPGDYLMRVEILALHSAYAEMGAQFYVRPFSTSDWRLCLDGGWLTFHRLQMSCAQLRVSGNGTFTPSETFGFPGAYQQDDPSILINIYGETGEPDNGGKDYSAPGNVPVITC